MGKTGHFESVWITLLGKYWKSCKMAKIAHSELFWTSVGKYWKVAKWLKLAILNQFKPLQLENIGKVAKWPKLPILNCFGPVW